MADQQAQAQAQAPDPPPEQQKQSSPPPLNGGAVSPPPPPPDDPTPPPQSCANATCTTSKPPPHLKPCSKCHSALYCSRPCQKADWKRHKKTCAQTAQRLAATDERPSPRVQSGRREGSKRGGNEQQRLRKWQFDT